MTEQELRSLVREAIARHVGADAAAPSPPRTLAPAFAEASAGRPAHPRTFVPSGHASHFLFLVPTGADADGPCLIEPAVTCNHCGYCRSYGH